MEPHYIARRMVMPGFDIIAVIVVAILLVLLFLVIKIIKTPIKWAFKLLIHAGFGFLGLLVINFFGVLVGVTLPITWLSALAVGVLGVPGVLLLLVIKFLL